MLLAQSDKRLSIILKDTKAVYGTSYKLESLMLKLQPVLNEYGIILGRYSVHFDNNVPCNPLIYQPARNKDVSDIKVELNEEETKINSDKEIKGNILVDNGRKEFKTTTKKSQLLGRTVVFFEFTGTWTNADDKNDFIPITFPIPVETRDNLTFEQSLGLATTYEFRTHFARQFNIPTPDKDADFENVSENVKEELKTTVKDNEFSKAYQDILTIDNKNPYVLKQENHFMINLKPVYGDCNSFYDYLKYKYTESPSYKDVKGRVAFKEELKDVYNKIFEDKTKGNK